MENGWQSHGTEEVSLAIRVACQVTLNPGTVRRWWLDDLTIASNFSRFSSQISHSMLLRRPPLKVSLHKVAESSLHASVSRLIYSSAPP